MLAVRPKSMDCPAITELWLQSWARSTAVGFERPDGADGSMRVGEAVCYCHKLKRNTQHVTPNAEASEVRVKVKT